MSRARNAVAGLASGFLEESDDDSVIIEGFEKHRGWAGTLFGACRGIKAGFFICSGITFTDTRSI